jgi:hypothetical protein
MDQKVRKLLKTQAAKTPIFGLSTIFMKTKELSSFSTMLMKNKIVIAIFGQRGKRGQTRPNWPGCLISN